MSSSTNDPFEGFDPNEFIDSFAAIEKAITSSEPIVRDFNRHFTDLLGACPTTDNGQWLTVSNDGEVAFHITLVDAFRLTSALQEIQRLIDTEDVRVKVPSYKKALEYVPTLFTQLQLKSSPHLVRRHTRKGQ